MTSSFGYQEFVNSVKHCMNLPKAHSGKVLLGSPYIAEVILWSIVDSDLLKLSPEEKSKQEYIMNNRSALSDKALEKAAQSFMRPSYNHFFIKKGVFNFDHSKNIFDESTKLVKNPRFRSETSGKYFYEYAEVRYPHGYIASDIDYVNRFFDHLNSKEDRQSYGIERGKLLDYELLLMQWRKFAALFTECVYTDSLKRQAQVLANLGNSDLQTVLAKWTEYASVSFEPGSKDGAREQCDVFAELFLQTAAVSLLLTHENTPETFPKLKFYLGSYYKQKSRITPENQDCNIAELKKDIRCLHYELARTYHDLLSSMEERRINHGVCRAPVSTGSAALFLKEFRYVYNALKHHPTQIRYYDEQLRNFFFCTVNDFTVQNEVIFRSPDDYSYLFELYTAWIDHIKFSDIFGDDEDGEYFTSINRKNDLIDSYIINKIVTSGKKPCGFNLVDKDFKENRYILHLADTGDLKRLHEMHNPDNGWDPKVFINSSDKSLRYATEHRQCWIIEDAGNDRPACCAIIVPIEHTEEDLKMYSGMRKCKEEFEKISDKTIHFSEFNSIIVGEKYRGLGFQRLMLSMCYRFAMEDGAAYIEKGEPVYIGAEVSPINRYSHRNFDLMGYNILSRIVFEDYENVKRDFVSIKVERC